MVGRSSSLKEEWRKSRSAGAGGGVQAYASKETTVEQSRRMQLRGSIGPETMDRWLRF